VDRIEAIEITWPSGCVGRYPGPAPDTGYLIREGDDRPKRLDGFREATPQSSSVTPTP
jgi:hypothetical protein